MPLTSMGLVFKQQALEIDAEIFQKSNHQPNKHFPTIEENTLRFSTIEIKKYRHFIQVSFAFLFNKIEQIIDYPPNFQKDLENAQKILQDQDLNQLIEFLKDKLLKFSGHQAEQQMYIRSGRLLGALTVMLDFIVDTDSTHYPQTLDKCTTCVVAYTAEVQLGIMLTAYNKSPSTISASVMLVKIIDIDQQAGELLTVQQLNIMQTLNSLVGALLPTINQDLAKGIENPIVGHFGIKELDITMGDSFMSLGLVLDA